MNAAAAPRRETENEVPQDPFKKALIASVVLHLGVFILATVGLPFISNDVVLDTPPVTVEIMTIDDITQTNKPPAVKKNEPEKPKPPPAKKDPPPPEKIEKPEPPDMKELKEPEPVPKPEPEKKEPEKKPEPKPEKPKEQPKPEPEKPKEEPQKDFDSLLKNLAPDAEEQTEEQAVEDEPAPDAFLSDRLTISELDAFKRQLEPCWNVPAGAKFAEDLVVEIRVFMNPDGSVRKASILDQGRYNRDTHFRAATDSALRALKNPRCSPLKLPLDKYDRWKTIVIRFDPKDML